MKKSILVFALIFISVSLYAETKDINNKTASLLDSALSKLFPKNSIKKRKKIKFTETSSGFWSYDGAFNGNPNKPAEQGQMIKLKSLPTTAKQPHK